MKMSNSLKESGFYKTPQWKMARKLALQRDRYLCQLKYPGCSRVANTVHHIKELEDFPELALELSNLQSCCFHCHEQTKERRRHRNVIEAPKGVRIIKM